MKFRRRGSAGLEWGNWFRWIGAIPRWIRGLDAKKRRLLTSTTTLLAAFVVGYGIAVFVLFPAPIFARDQAVPRVLGLELEVAEQTLVAAGLSPNDTVWVNHPNKPARTVVWQEPPPGVAVQPGTGLTLSVSRGPQRVPIPDVAGYEQQLAQRLLEAAGLTVASIDTSTSPQERGVVVATNPSAGQSRPPGFGVRLYVSVGAATISVPDLSGLTLDEARELLEEFGLALGSTQSRTSTASEPGLIIEQNPAAGTLSARGAAVAVTIVRGGS
jgi:serine/threonine-protein kinase